MQFLDRYPFRDVEQFRPREPAIRRGLRQGDDEVFLVGAHVRIGDSEERRGPEMTGISSLRWRSGSALSSTILDRFKCRCLLKKISHLSINRLLVSLTVSLSTFPVINALFIACAVKFMPSSDAPNFFDFTMSRDAYRRSPFDRCLLR